MQHKYAVIALVILSLFMPAGPVLASTSNENPLETVFVNRPVDRTSQMVSQSGEPTDSAPEIDPSLPEPLGPVEEAWSQHIFLPLVASANQMDNSVADAAAAAGGFDRNLIPIEMQVWWQPAYGHVHTGIKLPFAKEVSGVLALPVRIVMHMNPGKLHSFAITDENAKVIVKVDMKDQVCPMSAPGMVCAWGLTVNLNTKLLQDGCRELRVKNYINTPDGKQMITSSGIPLRVNNGGTQKDFNQSCSTNQMIGRGWYTGMDYTNGIIGNVPVAPVHGTLVLTARAQQASAHLFIALDKSHFIPAVQGWDAAQDSPGTILFDKDGSFQKAMPFSIDTTKLTNGWHNFQVRSTKPTGAVSQCSGCPAAKSFPAGMAKIWFYVAN
jgi:hypothetical protein